VDRSNYTPQRSFRLSDADLARLDAVAAGLGVGGRSEALRRLIEAAFRRLKKKSARPLDLS